MDGQANIWCIVNSEFFLFKIISFVAVTCNSAFMSSSAESPVSDSSVGVFVSLPESFESRVNDFGFFAIFCDTSFDLILAYVAFGRSQELDWSYVDLEDP